MRSLFCSATALGIISALSATAPAFAQPDIAMAMNAPDRLSWEFFLQVNARAGGTNVTFETWASDTDTFKMTPVFPTTPTPITLRPPVIAAIGREVAQENGQLLPAVPPDAANQDEETRRNRAAFDFIVNNGLYKVSGLKAAFGKPLSFPVDAIEVKANWEPVSSIATARNISEVDVAKLYHVNTAGDGKKYALTALHIISKLVPNWTWATFEHKDNTKRCDIIGCHDSFGAVTATVEPNATAGQGYPDCSKSEALKQRFASSDIDPAFTNYCLKGSQIDFTDNTGLATRLGNSITEDGFVNKSSCLSCHGRANFTSAGASTTRAGFDANGAPLGPLQPGSYWSFTSTPPIYQGMSGITRLATSADFVWSIPFCAVDDTVNPPKLSISCVGK